jgi:hypothetical protein
MSGKEVEKFGTDGSARFRDLHCSPTVPSAVEAADGEMAGEVPVRAVTGAAPTRRMIVSMITIR